MRTLLLGTLLGVCGCGEGAPRICPSSIEQAIVGGTSSPSALELSPAERRAIIQVDVPPPLDGICSAVVVAPTWALTAGHCAVLPVELKVRSGDDLVDVIEVTRHPDVDVAALRLAKPLTEVTPIELAQEPIAIGTEVEIAGYGLRDPSCLKQQKPTAEAAADELCADDPKPEPCGGILRFASEQVVAVDAAELTVDGLGESGACTGDSGGPLLVPGPFLAGTLTRGGASCVGKDVYVSSAGVYDWLSAILARESARH